MASNPRILLVSISSDVSKQIEHLSQEFDIPIKIINGGVSKDGHLLAKKLAPELDVIISQGGTALLIQDLVKTIPVITIRITVGDILQAFRKAEKFGKPLALLCARNEGLSEMEQIAKLAGNIQYKVFSYRTKEEYHKQFQAAISLENHTLVGISGFSLESLNERVRQGKINYVIIKSDPLNVRQAVLEAKKIIDLNNKEKLNSERMKSIIDFSPQGVISLDKNGFITSVNNAAEQILNIKSKNYLGMNIFDTAIQPDLKSVLGDGNFEVNKLVRFDETAFLLNRISVRVNDQHEESIITFQKVSHIQKLEVKARMQLYDKGFIAKHTFAGIIGTSDTMKSSIEKARLFSKTAASVLIEGETGTGKELFVQSIHNASPRKEGPFVAINCGALPENLLESELFGYEEGAFTGARKGGKTGLFELAHSGTIFLDEIGEVSPSIQSRLLRVLQEREILRVGGERIIKVDVRIIAATNQNLYKMMVDGHFRQDLFYRIGMLSLRVPPLRNRKEDIPALVDHFIREANKKYEMAVKRLPREGMEMIQTYAWPGNVRELEIFVEKLVILSKDNVVGEQLIEETLRDHMDAQTLPNQAQASNSISVNISSLKDMQMQIMEKLLERYGGNKKLLAEKLGISRVTVWNKMTEVNGNSRKALPGID